MDEMFNVRDYLNEGGKVLYTGQNAGFQYTANTVQLYDPTAANEQCTSDPAITARCLFLNGSGDLQGDVIEYWFGAYLLNFGAGLDAAETRSAILGSDTPFSSLSLVLNGGDSADNQANANSFIPTSGILPPSVYPQFTSWASMKYDRPGGPFAPHTGDQYAYSQIADVRSSAVPDGRVPAGGGSLTFWTSYNTEAEWDHLFVEAAPAGRTTGRLCRMRTGTRPRAPDRAAGRMERAASVARPLPDDHERHDLRPDRDDRGLERGLRRLGRLAGVEHRPRRLRRRRRRDPYLLRQRLVNAGARCLHRRHHPPRRLVDLVRGRRHRRLGGQRASARKRTEREQLHHHDRRGLPRRRRGHDRGHDLPRLRPRRRRRSGEPRRSHGSCDGLLPRSVGSRSERREGGASAPPSSSSTSGAGDDGEGLVPLALHERGVEGLEVEAEERLGVRGTYVQVPVVGGDRDAVEVRDLALAGEVLLQPLECERDIGDGSVDLAGNEVAVAQRAEELGEALPAPAR